MPDGDSTPAACRMRLGMWLRERRTAVGKVPAEIAAELRVSVSTIYRYEDGTTSIRSSDLQRWLDLLEITDPAERNELESLRTYGRKPNWWGHSAVRPTFGRLLGIESAATDAATWEALVVPGLLQTPAYAQAVMEVGDPLSAEVIAERIRIRMKRQESLRRETAPLRLSAIVDEGVLHRQIGGQDVWREQLKHLFEVAKLKNVTLQVLPFAGGAHAGLHGSFLVLRFGGDMPPVAYIETASGDLAADGAEALRYLGFFDSLRADALSPTESRKLIDRLLREPT